LSGGGRTRVRREGDLVLRPVRPWSATVLALLAHLRSRGFTAAPEPVGVVDGRSEVVRWIEAEPAPELWSVEAAYALGALVGDLHAATASFEGGGWQWWFVGDLPVTGAPVVGHRDLNPWNVLARDGMPVAFVDWETAGPCDARWELAQCAFTNAALFAGDDRPPAAERAAVCAAIVSGYGLAREGRAAFVDDLVTFARASAAHDAAEGLDRGVTWRLAAAEWMERERAALTAALR
jgi:Ser/Thr protein kinase RdoA (MazF antagonist)